MAQVFTVSLADATILANATLAIIRPAGTLVAGGWLEILRVDVDQQGTSTSQQLGIILARKSTAFGTYVGATPSPLTIGAPISAIVSGTAGAAATAGVNASAEGAGAVTVIKSQGFNNLSGYLWLPTPEETIHLLPGVDPLIVKLRGTPTTLTGWNCTVTYLEHI